MAKEASILSEDTGGLWFLVARTNYGDGYLYDNGILNFTVVDNTINLVQTGTSR